MPCKREVMAGSNGKLATITVATHSFSWSGSMPCTGTYQCLHCGMTEQEADRADEKRVNEILANVAFKAQLHADFIKHVTEEK